TLIDSDAATPSRGAPASGTRALGEALLVDMFLWQPHARASLLAAAFSAMGTYLAALRIIAATHSQSMRDLASPLARALSLVWLAPPAFSRPALAAFIPACKHSPALRDQVCVMLRKELYGADPVRAALSAFAQCRLLADAALPSDHEQVDAVIALQPLLSAGLHLRAQLYASLLPVLSSPAALQPQAWKMLQGLIMRRARRYFRASPSAGNSGEASAAGGAGGQGGGVELDVARCFEMVPFNGAQDVRRRECVPGLLRCVAALSERDAGAAQMLLALSAQLSSPAALARLLTPPHLNADEDTEGAAAEGVNGEEGVDGVEVGVGARVGVVVGLVEMMLVGAARGR
ncbi:hypothetical protein T484DRAFT_1779882, partial [Baffinella frigidus]